MQLETHDVTLNILDDGDPAAPPVLLLHGITQSTAAWGWLVPYLVDGHRVLRLDFRGHGESSRAPHHYDWPGYVADATAVCERIAGQPAVVVGHSLGGGTAAALAQTRPDLVRGVVLEDASLAPRPPIGHRPLEGNSLRDGFEALRQSLPELQGSGMSVEDLTAALRVAPATHGGTFADHMHEDAIAAMAISMLQLDPTVLDPLLHSRMHPVFDPDKELPVPGIVLAADPESSNAVTRPEDLERLAEHSPHLDLRTVKGASHLIHDELVGRPAVREAVEDLLERLDA